MWWYNTESDLITLQRSIFYWWCDRRPGLFRVGDVQTVSLVLQQQQQSPGMQGAHWSISQCLLHYYLCFAICTAGMTLSPCHSSILLPQNNAREGLNWLLKIYFPVFLSQPSPFVLRGPLCSWWNAIKHPQPSPYWPLGGTLNSAYSPAALAAFKGIDLHPALGKSTFLSRYYIYTNFMDTKQDFLKDLPGIQELNSLIHADLLQGFTCCAKPSAEICQMFLEHRCLDPVGNEAEWKGRL